jgi:hypothetical protein
MILGKDAFEGVCNQLQFPVQAYQQMVIVATHTWRELPAKGAKSQEITKILQGPNEPFQDFVARLMQAVGRMVADHEAGTVLVRQLAFENDNKYCRQALCPHRRKVSIQEMIRICSDIGAHHIQEAALGAALKEVIHPSKKGGNGACFTCGWLGHLPKNVARAKDSPPIGLE